MRGGPGRSSRSDRDAYAAATVRLAALDAVQDGAPRRRRALRDVLAKSPKDFAAQLLNADLSSRDHKRDEALAEVNASPSPLTAARRRPICLAGRILAEGDRNR